MQELKASVRTAIDHVDLLTAEVRKINRKTTSNRILVVVLSVVVLVVVAMLAYGAWYVVDTNNDEKAVREGDLVSLENSFRTGCENSVKLRQDSRNELLEFGRYLGARKGLPSEEIDAALQELVVEFDQVSPLRDCEAEAAARAEERRGRET